MKGPQFHPQSSAHEITVVFSLVAAMETIFRTTGSECDLDNAGGGLSHSYGGGSRAYVLGVHGD